MPSWTIHNAEVIVWAREELARIARGESAPYHAILCDPPYGLEFMGKDWDSPSGAVIKDAASVGGFQDGAGGNPYSRSRIRIGTGASFELLTRQWGEALMPLLYPGALVFMFAGTRMWHRLAAGMEDAGFQMWDTLLWLHGQGFPKAQDISKLIDKAHGDERGAEYIREDFASRSNKTEQRQSQVICGEKGHYTRPGSESSAPWAGHKTAQLKPAWEPVLCFRAPDGGKSYAELALAHGSGALNVDGGRIGTEKFGGYVRAAAEGGIWNPRTRGLRKEYQVSISKGRYPANLALECTCERTELIEVRASGHFPEKRGSGSIFGGGSGLPQETGRSEAFVYGGKAVKHSDPNCPCFQLDEQAGESVHGAGAAREGSADPRPKVSVPTSYSLPNNTGDMYRFGDSGGPSRFFYCPKASRGEREAGLERLPKSAWQSAVIEDGNYVPPSVVNGVHNAHPTVKPIDLCRWLATLLLPPDSVKPRRILVPFAGVASEMVGCLLAGWDEVVGVELDEKFSVLGKARLEHWALEGDTAEPTTGVLNLPERAAVVSVTERAQGRFF